MMTNMEILYNAYRDSGLYQNPELCELLGWDSNQIRQAKSKLKRKGYIAVDYEGKVVLLKPYREDVERPQTFKAEIYREMLEIYMDDFRHQETFKDRLAVGQEIRLILKTI